MSTENTTAMSRAAIFGNIRRGLNTSEADTKRQQTVESRLSAKRNNLIPARAQLPFAEQVELFKAMATEAVAEIIELDSVEQIPQACADWLSRQQISELISASNSELRDLNWSPLEQQGIEKIERVAEAGDIASLTLSFAGIAETGTLMLAVSAFTPYAATAALYYLLHSTMATAALFLVADLLLARRESGDLLKAAPATVQNGFLAALFFAAAIGIAGMPPLSGFLGKLLVLDALRVSDYTWLVWAVVLVGSLLTIVGYSINDTVVVYDRIREFANLFKTEAFDSVANKAINSTLSRTLLTSGSYNTLPLEIFGMTTNVTTPVLFALGTLTTVFSLLIILFFLLVVWLMNRRQAQQGSDAGQGMV